MDHNLLLVNSALNDDRDGVLNSLEVGVVLQIGPEGQIWGPDKYQQLDPGWIEAGAVWLEHVFSGKHGFPTIQPPIIRIPDDVQIAIAGDWGTGNWRGHLIPHLV